MDSRVSVTFDFSSFMFREVLLLHLWMLYVVIMSLKVFVSFVIPKRPVTVNENRVQ